MKRSVILLVAVVGLATMTVAPAGAGDDLPFKTKATLVSASELQPIPELCGNPAQGFLGEVDVYRGTGTHLGRFKLVETVCLDLRGFDPPIQPVLSFEVFGTYYAANGDELTFYVDGVINVVTGVIDDGGFEFTGGSGRFESATGSGDAVLLRDADGDVFAQTTSGVISYAASDRRNK